MKKILFFGDSLTAGYGMANPASESFPGILQRKIDQENLPFEVINAGLSGDTSSGGLERLDYWLSRKPDVFVLELGINDFLRGLPITSTERNLDNILKRVRQALPQCQLAVLGLDVPANNATAAMAQFAKLYRTLATNHQATFMPNFLQDVMGNKDLNFNDGIHPTKKGYEVIAGNVWPVILPLLKNNIS